MTSQPGPPPAESPSGQQAGVPPDQSGTERPAKRGSHRAREWLILAVATIVGTLLIRTYVVESYRIPSASMEKTLHGCTPGCNDDRILVDKLSYKLHDIHRGDIVVFKATGDWIEVVGGPDDVVKRVIGLPGDTVRCCDAAGHVVRNGKSLDEPYVYVDGPDPRKTFGPVTVAKGQLFVMGDHRNDSSDSRYNGTIPESSVVGHAFMRVWPISRIALLH